MLNQDYEAATRSGVDGLISTLERWRGGNLSIDGQDFEGFGRGSRFYPLLYMLTRVHGARDFGSGLPLHSHLLGYLTSLQVHHIFPKAVLYDAGYPRSQVNAVANFCFLTQDTNLAIGKRRPEDYFPRLRRTPGRPGVPVDSRGTRRCGESTGIPTSSPPGASCWPTPPTHSLARCGQAWRLVRTNRSNGRGPWSIHYDDDSRTEEVAALIAELTELGCAEPAVDCEISDPATGKPLAIAEACWPEGLQPGQGNPVVLELDPGESDLARLEELGYEVFISTDSLRGYVRRRNQEAAGPVEEPAREAGRGNQQPKTPRTLRLRLTRSLPSTYEPSSSEP